MARKHYFDTADVLRIARAIRSDRAEDEYLTMVAALHKRSAELLTEAVILCRMMEPEPMSWEAIGEMLGYTRASAKQQAQRKYGPAVAAALALMSEEGAA